MAITLDKNKTSSTVVFTLLKDINETYRLELHSPYTHKTYEVELGDNTSTHVERYDRFEIPVADYQHIEAGRYQYKVWQTFDSGFGIDFGEGEVVEVGTCIVTENAALIDDTIALSQNEEDDDFIVLQS